MILKKIPRRIFLKMAVREPLLAAMDGLVAQQLAFQALKARRLSALT